MYYHCTIQQLTTKFYFYIADAESFIENLGGILQWAPSPFWKDAVRFMPIFSVIYQGANFQVLKLGTIDCLIRSFTKALAGEGQIARFNYGTSATPQVVLIVTQASSARAFLEGQQNQLALAGIPNLGVTCAVTATPQIALGGTSTATTLQRRWKYAGKCFFIFFPAQAIWLANSLYSQWQQISVDIQNLQCIVQGTFPRMLKRRR